MGIQSAKEIQYYDHALKELKHPQSNKIKKFLKFNCIEKVNFEIYICKPIEGYNTRTYSITREGCNCQGFQKRKNCTHVEAVKIFRKFELIKTEGQKTLF